MSVNTVQSPIDSSPHGVSLDRSITPAPKFSPLEIPSHGHSLSETEMLNEMIHATRTWSSGSQGWSTATDSNIGNIYNQNTPHEPTGDSFEERRNTSEAIKDAPIVFLPIEGELGLSDDNPLSQITGPFPAQHGSIGVEYRDRKHENGFQLVAKIPELSENAVLANMDMPWSAFICGSQGAGKSHTLSCLLENGLLQNDRINHLPHPLATLVFHYDHYTSKSCSQICEAAYLCSSGIPVTVLVSPSNIWAMTDLYSNLPGLPSESPRPRVLPLYLAEKSLDISTMLKLMAIDPTTDHVPLYMETVMSILREMAMEGKGAGTFCYAEFRSRLDDVVWAPGQRVPLDLRLQLLDSFLEPSEFTRSTRPAPAPQPIWSFKPGTLTIIDLSDPFVGSNDACSLFSICLSLFLEDRNESGRVVVLDEAHKFLLQSGAARVLTADLTSIIRQQRHTGTRVYIATQEPTLSPELIDLCNATFVHRFMSPAWYEILKKHLAGANKNDGKRGNRSLFEDIVALETGEALLFCPTAVFLTKPGQYYAGEHEEQPKNNVWRLGSNFARIKVRSRITHDGGKSILATETTNDKATPRIQYEIAMHIVEKKEPLRSNIRSRENKNTGAKENELSPTTVSVPTPKPDISAIVPKATGSHAADLPASPWHDRGATTHYENYKSPRKQEISDVDIEATTRREIRRHYKEFKWHNVKDIMWKRFTMVVELGLGQETGSLWQVRRYDKLIRSVALDEHKKCREKQAHAKQERY